MKATDDRVQQARAEAKRAQPTGRAPRRKTRKERRRPKASLHMLTEGGSRLDMLNNIVKMLPELDYEDLSSIEHMVVSTLANSVMQEAMDLTLRQLRAKNGPGNGPAGVPGARPADGESAKPNQPE